MKVVVLTARIGNGDATLFEPKTFPDTRYVCVTEREAPGWEIVAPQNLSRPRWSARYAKSKVHEWFPDSDWSIWMDASLDLKVRPSVIVGAARSTGCDVAGFLHPRRCCILHEAQAILKWGFADQTRLNRQLRTYREAGYDIYPHGYPQTLTNGCLIVRKNTPQVAAFSARWFAEIEEHTLREQMSLDYAAWATGVKIGYIRGNYITNPFARYKYASHISGRVGYP